MTLRKLLLGTSAAMFVGGASITTAQAADPNPAGLVVTTMANYVEQCNNGNGWKKRDWCITVAGSIEWTHEIGTEIDFGDNPFMNDANNPGGAEVVAAGVVVLVVLQPGRVWRWSKRGYFVWRTWRLLRRKMSELGINPARRGAAGQA